MDMTHLSRNNTLRTTATWVLAALLLTVVATDNNNVVLVEAHQCAVGNTCLYGTSCFVRGLQLLCDSPSYYVMGTIFERSHTPADDTSPSVPESPTSTAVTVTAVSTKAATVTTIIVTAAPTPSPPTNVPTNGRPTDPPFTSPWTDAPTDKCWPGNTCEYNTSCLIGRIQLLCNAPHWDVTGSFFLRNNNPNNNPITSPMTTAPEEVPAATLPSFPLTAVVPTNSSIVVTAAPTTVPPPTNAPTVPPPTNATAAAATPTAVPTKRIVGTAAPTTSPRTNGTNAATVPPTNATNATVGPPTNATATATAVPTKRIVVTAAPIASPPTNAPTVPSTTTIEVPPSPSPTTTATEAQTKRIVATPSTPSTTTDQLCITNGVGATCPSGAGLPEIACCSSGLTGAFFNACCPSQFVGIPMSTVTVTVGGGGVTTDLNAFGMVIPNGLGVAEPADCVVTTNRQQGCPEFDVPGNEGGKPLTLPSRVEGPCVEMVGSKAACSTTQGTCTTAGRTFPVCCPTCATGTYLPGQSCAVILPDPAACGYNMFIPPPEPPTAPVPTSSLPTNAPTLPLSFTSTAPPTTTTSILNTASNECAASAACRTTNLQGNCCPTDAGVFLGCCHGIDPTPTTPDEAPFSTKDSDAAPEAPVLGQTLVSVSDPVSVPELEPTPIVPESVMDPTNIPTTSTNTVIISDSVVDPTNVPTVSTPPTTTNPPTLSPSVSTISPTTVTEVVPITAVDPTTQVPTETNMRGAVISKALSSDTTADSSSATAPTRMVSSAGASFLLTLLGSTVAAALAVGV